MSRTPLKSVKYEDIFYSLDDNPNNDPSTIQKHQLFLQGAMEELVVMCFSNTVAELEEELLRKRLDLRALGWNYRPVKATEESNDKSELDLAFAVLEVLHLSHFIKRSKQVDESYIKRLGRHLGFL